MDPQILVLLFFVAVIAGTVDSIAGGGGLITIPALLLSGLPPLQALATNKAQGVFGTLTAVIVMVRKKILNISVYKKEIIYVAVGAVLGTALVHIIDKSVLEFLIPICLIIMTLYVLLSPKVSDIESEPKIGKRPFNYILSSIGFYDGALGPGTGSMFALSHVGLRGTAIIQATARAKLFNFISNIFSFFVFVIGGHVVWMTALVMIAGQLIGGYIGAHLVINKGVKIIKPLIAITSISMLIKYFFF